jgi:hypothetical protein
MFVPMKVPMKIAAPKLTVARLCGAPRRGGKGFCCRPASAGKSRCRLHGADATGPTTEAGKAAAVAAMVAGRARWIEKQRELKAAGKIARCPGGRPSRDGSRGQPERDKVAEQGRPAADGAVRLPKPPANSQPPTHMAASVPAPLAVAPAPVAKPWAAQGHGEKLDTLTTSALDTLRDILAEPTALDDLKKLSVQKDAALSIIGAKIKVEAGKMQQEDRGATLNRLLACIKAGEIPTFLDEGNPIKLTATS